MFGVRLLAAIGALLSLQSQSAISTPIFEPVHSDVRFNVRSLEAGPPTPLEPAKAVLSLKQVNTGVKGSSAHLQAAMRASRGLPVTAPLVYESFQRE